METTVAGLKSRSWTKTGYIISTDPSLIPIAKLNDIFGSDAFYWGKSLPEEAMRQTLENSLCFGLYSSATASGDGTDLDPKDHVRMRIPPRTVRMRDLHDPQANLELVGIARCITDYTTFLYLTDVWIEPEAQGGGLGKWLVGCIREVIEEMPYLRRSILFTGDWTRSVPFYEKLLGMNLVETKKGENLALMERKGPGHPTFGKQTGGYN
ncbi:gcn5-related n-acetyltransferase [Pestalotiopsis sp. NC0098]|nr:gcn5-related n-acetyltransferase [Pestalotiopsis sp. NC0098]